MNKLPIISVVMPVYNRKDYLPEAIESVLNQTYSDFELIIIDDGSTDRSPDIIEQYAKNDPRIIVVVNPKNCGNYYSRNKGMALAKGQFIAVMDSDDVSLPERFEKQLAYFNTHPEVDILGTQGLDVDESLNPIQTSNYPLDPAQVRWQLMFGHSLCHPSIMMRRRVLDEFGFRYHDQLVSQDYELFMRASTNLKIANLPEVLIYVRKHQQNISTQKRQFGQDQLFQIVRSNFMRILDKSLPDEVISGLLIARHQKKQREIKTVRTAWQVSAVLVRLMRHAMGWELTDEDRFYIRQNTASRLRRIWQEQHFHPFLLPFVLYSIVLDPGVLGRKARQWLRQDR